MIQLYYQTIQTINRALHKRLRLTLTYLVFTKLVNLRIESTYFYQIHELQQQIDETSKFMSLLLFL